MPTNRPPPPTDWPGFDWPRYTPMPDAIADIWLRHLSGAELKVLIYIVRHTFGYQKDADDISLSQLMDGITKHDGTGVQDYGTGLSQPAITAAVRALVRYGLITAERQTTRAGGDAPTRYRLVLRGSKQTLDPPPKKVRTGSKIRRELGAKSVSPQETVQQTEEQEGETMPEFSPAEHEVMRRAGITPDEYRALRGLSR